MDGEGFSTRGGIWIFDRGSGPGSSRSTVTAPWPSAELRATADRLTISSVLLEPIVVTRATLVSITPYDMIPLLGRGLRFEASDQDDVAVFWTYRRSTIMTRLISLGWTVAG